MIGSTPPQNKRLILRKTTFFLQPHNLQQQAVTPAFFAPDKQLVGSLSFPTIGNFRLSFPIRDGESCFSKSPDTQSSWV